MSGAPGFAKSPCRGAARRCAAACGLGSARELCGPAGVYGQGGVYAETGFGKRLGEVLQLGVGIAGLCGHSFWPATDKPIAVETVQAVIEIFTILAYV